MLPHPDTARQLATFDHQQRLRDATRFRLADQAARGHPSGVTSATRLQDGLGRTLIRAGLRLRGIAPVPGVSDGSPAIGSGTIQ
jgi:hypothetical protein